MKRALAGLVSVACVVVCGLAGVLLWDPDRFLFKFPLGFSREQLVSVNFLSHAYAGWPEMSWVLLWVAAAGAMLAAVSSGHLRLAWEEGNQPRVHVIEPTSSPTYLILFWLMSALLVSLLAAHVYMWFSLARNEYLPIFFPLWIIGIVAFAYPCWRLNHAAGVPFELPLNRYELVGLLVLCGVFVAYCSYDSLSWKYSFGGDELGFWTFAGGLAGGRVINVFSSLEGVAGYHPILSSLYQSYFMRVLGVNVFAWHLSSIVAAALALPVFYLFLREVIGVRAAVAGVIILAGNHYLITYAHMGLNNVQVLFPTFLALALWFWGVRRGDWASLYWAGVATGLGFYTFYSSRLTLAFVLLAFVLVPVAASARTRVGWFLMYAFGFLLTVVPLVVTPGDFFGWMLNQSAVGSEGGSLMSRIATAFFSPGALAKWEYCWIDPFYSPRLGRFMWGSWIDPWVAAFFLLGLAWAALRWWRHRVLLWLLGCYFGSVIGIAVLSQYAVPPDTRMLFLVPFYVAFAVLALEVLRDELVRVGLLSSPSGAAFLGLVVATSLAANQYRYLVVSPERYQVPPYGLVVKVAQTYPQDRHIYFVAPPKYWVELVTGLAGMYGFADRIAILRTGEIAKNDATIQFPATFVFANMFPERMEETIALLRARYPHHRYEDVRDGAGGSSLQVIDVEQRE